MFNRSILSRAFPPSVVNKVDLLKITDKMSNLQIAAQNIPSSSSSTITHSSTFPSSSKITVDTLSDSPLYSYSKDILDRFIKNMNKPDFTHNLLDRTKSSFMDIPHSLCSIPSKSAEFFLTLGYRFCPGQVEFLTKTLRLPNSADSLISFKNRLGLTLESLPTMALIPYNNASSLFSRIFVEAITFYNGHYGRFLVLVEFGLKCTVWYGFHPGDPLCLPVDGLLFSPIECYDNLINHPAIHVQPGFEKITLIENESNILPTLASAFTQEKPFVDINIPHASGSVLMGVSLGLAIVVLLSLGIDPNVDLNGISA